MAKQLKISIKNTQLAKKVGLEKIKDKLAENKDQAKTEKEKVTAQPEAAQPEIDEKTGEAPRRIRAKSKSRFAPPDELEAAPIEEEKSAIVEEPEVEEIPQDAAKSAPQEEAVAEQRVVEEVAPPHLLLLKK